MTSAFFSRRLALLAAVATSLFVAACGGDKDSNSGPTSVRALNLSTDVASVDVYTDSTKRFSALATDALATYIGLDSATYSVNVKAAGDGATLFTRSFGLSQDQHYTALVWGRQAALNVTMLPEDEDNSGLVAGNTKLRILNATVDTGTVDVFLTATSANLADTQATQAGVLSGVLSGYRELSAGTYRLRVTGEKNPNDVRLDVPAVTLADRGATTLVLTAGAGGVLLNGTLIAQQGTATAFKNGKARVRLAAGVDAASTVSASVGGTTISGAVASPRVGGYVLVNAGTADLTVSINGAALAPIASSFAEGGDYTVLAYGPAASAQAVLLNDDNRLPSAATNAKLRLVHGRNGVSPVSLTLDSQLLQPSDIVLGAASAYYAAPAATAAVVEISSQDSATTLFTRGTVDTRLTQAQGVYTVFMLGGAATPQGLWIKDR
ncbi:conserved exported hypothetical protein [Rubrivivax sp. A210]|uniref:DUF4397 domain-containing protein n=1 Tax=Rubrivivax sp. A210 TaxID=2772301 RepID=UPI001918096B|nr:DUF4397 domain-containing protein [Rubrivivax sp. A210]CAD5373308.1 conserved exported hypothetical protein [Rubrivivax sp. A210]